MPSPTDLLSAVVRWPSGSQQGSRHNALVASTALAARRAEREEVQEFLAAHAPPARELPDAAGG